MFTKACAGCDIFGSVVQQRRFQVPFLDCLRNRLVLSASSWFWIGHVTRDPCKLPYQTQGSSSCPKLHWWTSPTGSVKGFGGRLITSLSEIFYKSLLWFAGAALQWWKKMKQQIVGEWNPLQKMVLGNFLWKCKLRPKKLLRAQGWKV